MYVELLDILLSLVKAMLFPELTFFYLVHDKSPYNVVESWIQDILEMTLLSHPLESSNLSPTENIYRLTMQNLDWIAPSSAVK